jgi:Leucine-rich repeat (LRR) protein
LEYELQQTDAGLDLVVTGPWTGACLDIVATGTVDGLVLNTAFGFSETDLGFIGSWPISRLKVVARNVNNLSPVYRLSETLTELDVLTATSASLDLGQLTKIQVLGADWDQVSETLQKLEHLKAVFLRHFSPKDMTCFKANSALESIRLKDRPRLESLDGLQVLSSLTEVGVYLASKLSDISALASVAAPLQKLELVACKGIRKIDPIRELTKLKFLNIADCGDIESIEPLSVLQGLEEFHGYGSTKISDGDLSPLLQLPALGQYPFNLESLTTPAFKQLLSICTFVSIK